MGCAHLYREHCASCTWFVCNVCGFIVGKNNSMPSRAIYLDEVNQRKGATDGKA